MRKYDFIKELEGIKTTKDYFNLTIDELLITKKSGYTREECKIFDSGLEIIFFDDEKELLNEEEEFNKYIQSKEFEVKTILKTINGRICVVLN